MTNKPRIEDLAAVGAELRDEELAAIGGGAIKQGTDRSKIYEKGSDGQWHWRYDS